MRTFEEFKEEIAPITARETVGLAVYYLQTHGGEDIVSPEQVSALFNINRTTMSESIIASHMHNLRENGLLQRIERELDSGYILTPEGTRKFERRESGEGIGSPPPADVDSQSIEERYEALYDEAQGIRTELEKVRSSTKRWRKRSWMWRIGSFVAGTLFGAGFQQIFSFLLSQL